jgi:G:T/U-mismatch repair DNA glycosylase
MNMTTENKTSQTTEPAIAVKPVLATALSKKQKRDLLEKSQLMQALTAKQIRALIWWEWFNHKKINKFWEMLQIGKAARFAFEDAQRCC